MNTGRVVVVTAAADVTLRATGLITFPLLARRAGADGYGAYTQVSNIAAFVIPFASLGLSGSMVRFFATRRWGPAVRRDLTRVLLVVVVSSGALAPILFLSAGWLNGLVLGWPNGEALFRVAAGLVVVGAIEQVVLNLLWARDRLYAYSGYKVAQALVLIVALLATLRGPEDLVRTMAALVIARTGLVLAALLIVARGDDNEGSVEGSTARIPEMVRYGLPVAVSAIGLWIINLADRVVIGHYRDADDLGRYGSVYTIASLVAIATGPFFLPALGRLMRASRAGDRDRVAADVSLFHRYVSIGAIGAAIGLAVLIQPAVRLIGGQDFAVSSYLVVMIVGGLFLDQWNGMAHYILLCNDQTAVLQNAWLGAGAFNVVANLVAVPAWGIQGAAAMTLLTFALLNGILYIAASRYVPLRHVYCWSTSGKAAVAGAFSAIAALRLANDDAGLPSLSVAGVVFGLGYIAVLVLLRELRRSDLVTIRDMLRRGREASIPTAPL